MTHAEFERTCWTYYLMLEDIFINSTRYVYLSKNNFNTYSFEYVNQLLVICSEFENVCKIISNKQNETTIGIKNLLREIYQRFPNIKESKINLITADISLVPFKLNEDSNLFWWTPYNKIKHNRAEKLILATLENVLNALAALFALNMYQLRHLGENVEPDFPKKSSQLFNLQGFMFKNIDFNGCFGRISGL